MRFRFRLLRILIAFLALLAAVSHGQGPAENLVAAGEEQFRNGNYKRAAEIYKDFIQKYPTSQLIYSVRYQYGLALLLDGQYEPAIKILEELAKPNTPSADIKEQSKLLLGNAFGGVAMIKPKSERSSWLKRSLGAFEDYLKQYGQKGKSVPNAVFGKAGILLELGRFDEAIGELEKFAAQFPQSDLGPEVDQLLAKTYAAKASELFQQKKTAEAEALLAKAQEKFEKAGAKNGDPVQANEAFYAAGKTFLDFGQYGKALDYFRRLKSKNELIDFQQARVQRLREQRAAQVRAGGRENDVLRGEIDRETGKLSRITNQYDLFLAAQQYIAQAFLAQQKYEESIIVNERFLPFYDEDLRRLAEYQMAAAQIGRGELKTAEDMAAAFADKYKGDAIGEDLFYRLSEKYRLLGQGDKAMQMLELSLQKYPNGTFAESALLTRAGTLTQSGETDKAAEEYARFLKMFPKSSLLDRALYLRGMNYQKQGKFDLSTRDFRDVVQNHPRSAFREDAFFRIGLNLASAGKAQEAIDQLVEFEKTFPKSELASAVLYQLGYAYEQAGKTDLAIQTHRKNVQEHPRDDMAPYSAFSIGVIHYNQRRFAEMNKAFEDYIAKYPEHKNVADAQNLMAYAYQAAKDYDKAVALYEQVVLKNPQSEAGARAQLSLGVCRLLACTDAAFRPNSLPEAEKRKWEENNKKAIEALSRVITAYPQSKQVDEALSNLVSAWKYRIDSGLAVKGEGRNAFKQLADSVGSDKALGAKIQFTFGAFLSERGETAEALPVFEEAFAASSGVTLPLESYKNYLKSLLSNEPPMADKAIAVAQRMISEYPSNPLGLGEGYYWLGRASFEKGDVGQAESYFEKVGKIPETAGTDLEGQVKLFKGQILERRKEYDEAIKIYTALQKTMPVKSRVEPIMRMGYALEAKGDAASLDAAYKKFQEVVVNFSGSPREPEAIFKAGETAMKMKKEAEARRLFDRLGKDYADSPWITKAKEAGYVK